MKDNNSFIFFVFALIGFVILFIYLYFSASKKNKFSQNEPITSDQLAEKQINKIEKCHTIYLYVDDLFSVVSGEKRLKYLVKSKKPSKTITSDLKNVFYKIYDEYRRKGINARILTIIERHGEELNFFFFPIETSENINIDDCLKKKYGFFIALSRNFIFHNANIDEDGNINVQLEVIKENQRIIFDNTPFGTAKYKITDNSPVVVMGNEIINTEESVDKSKDKKRISIVYSYTCYAVLSV